MAEIQYQLAPSVYVNETTEDEYQIAPSVYANETVVVAPPAGIASSIISSTSVHNKLFSGLIISG